MAQFVSPLPSVEVRAALLQSLVAAMDIIRPKALEILSRHGIEENLELPWYPLQNGLDALKTIADEIGVNILYSIGQQIPNFATLPPEVDSIDKGLVHRGRNGFPYESGIYFNDPHKG